MFICRSQKQISEFRSQHWSPSHKAMFKFQIPKRQGRSSSPRRIDPKTCRTQIPNPAEQIPKPAEQIPKPAEQISTQAQQKSTVAEFKNQIPHFKAAMSAQWKTEQGENRFHISHPIWYKKSQQKPKQLYRKIPRFFKAWRGISTTP